MRNASAIELAALQLDAVLDASGNPTVLTDERGVITRWTLLAVRMFRYLAAGLIGQPSRWLILLVRQVVVVVVVGEVPRGSMVHSFEPIRRRKDGLAILISLTVSPFRDDHGRIVGA